MENAAKALIMAASVLVGLLILSLAVYLFITFGASSKQLHEEIDSNRLNEFNTQFTVYELKNDNTIYDIISVANLAKENNTYYELSGPANGNFYITVNAKTKGASTIFNLQDKTKDDLDTLTKNELNAMIEVYDSDRNIYYKKLPTYSCKVTISETTGRVSNVMFTQN